MFQTRRAWAKHRRHGYIEGRGTSAPAPLTCWRPIIQQSLGVIAGQRIVVFQPPPLPGGIGLPVQFVLGTTEPFTQLNDVTQNFLHEALASGLFIFLDTDLRIDNPQVTVDIDRSKAALMGLKMNDVGAALGAMLGGGYVNYFGLDGRSYKVIPQVQQRYRLNPSQILDYHIRTASGASVPLSTIARVTTHTEPESLNHFQQLNAALIQGVVAPGVTMGTAMTSPGRPRRAHPAGRLLSRLRRAVPPVEAGIPAASWSPSASR